MINNAYCSLCRSSDILYSGFCIQKWGGRGGGAVGDGGGGGGGVGGVAGIQFKTI